MPPSVKTIGVYQNVQTYLPNKTCFHQQLFDELCHFGGCAKRVANQAACPLPNVIPNRYLAHKWIRMTDPSNDEYISEILVHLCRSL